MTIKGDRKTMGLSSSDEAENILASGKITFHDITYDHFSADRLGPSIKNRQLDPIVRVEEAVSPSPIDEHVHPTSCLRYRRERSR